VTAQTSAAGPTVVAKMSFQVNGKARDLKVVSPVDDDCARAALALVAALLRAGEATRALRFSTRCAST
jgi:hypothetical protein